MGRASFGGVVQLYGKDGSRTVPTGEAKMGPRIREGTGGEGLGDSGADEVADIIKVQ